MLKSIPVMALVFAVLTAIGDVRPDILEAAHGSRILVWIFITLTYSAIIVMLYYATKDVGKTNAELDREKESS